MPGPSPLAPFIAPLERLALPYCITGSVAASVYGEPRLTADIDVVLLLKLENVAALRPAFPETDYYVPLDETLRLELARSTRGMFNVIHHATQFKADLYLAARDPLHAWALEHRRRIQLERATYDSSSPARRSTSRSSKPKWRAWACAPSGSGPGSSSGSTPRPRADTAAMVETSRPLTPPRVQD